MGATWMASRVAVMRRIVRRGRGAAQGMGPLGVRAPRGTLVQVPSFTRSRLHLLPVATLVALALGVSSLVSPSRVPVPLRDSGVFLYTAWRMLSGDVPYRDVWDHKPPAIYFIDALGLALGGGSLWGVWALETIGLVCAASVGYLVVARATNWAGGFVGNALWLLAMYYVHDGGNLTEGYGIPVQFAGLFALSGMLSGRAKRRHSVLFGLSGAMAFLLKPTLTGIWMAGGI